MCIRDRSLAVGELHNCVVLLDGSVACWGDNSMGQLGNGSTDASGIPTPVTVQGLPSVSSIAAGTYETCAVLGDHTVRCWGSTHAGFPGPGEQWLTPTE